MSTLRRYLRNARWLILIGIPLAFIALIGAVAGTCGWVWLDDKCQAWFEEINGG